MSLIKSEQELNETRRECQRLAMERDEAKVKKGSG